MYSGHLGNRHTEGDVFGLFTPRRERTDVEIDALGDLHMAADRLRETIMKHKGSGSLDQRCISTALTKLDESVMWAKLAIDA